MPIKTIWDYLYRVRIHFIYKETADNAYRFIKKQGDFLSKEDFDKNFKKSSGFVFWANEQDICLVLIEWQAGTFVHELFHVVDNVLRDKGIKLTEGSSEAYAYYLGWITDKIIPFLTESDKKIKAKNGIRNKRTRSSF